MKQVWVFLIAAVLDIGSVQVATPQSPVFRSELVAWQQDEDSDDLFRAGEGLLKATFTLYGNLVTATFSRMSDKALL